MMERDRVGRSMLDAEHDRVGWIKLGKNRYRILLKHILIEREESDEEKKR